ncbi:hypothetical protein G9A89_003811 [Geosiphon pyriformis]|nr:hypothetical protein G9A89_003811 [Geosiphon pyriformis]
MQANILATLQGIQTALGRRNNILLPLFRGDTQDPIEWLNDFKRAATTNQYDNEYKFQIVGGYFQGFPITWFLQETDASAYQKIIRWIPTNAEEENISFTIQFETKFRTSILISKWHIKLERRTQDFGEVVTEYAKAIKKLIKHIDSGRNWTEEQKIHSFTKGLRTDLLYALWSLLALKNNPTMDMTIELAQKIKDNQRMHLGFTLSVFVPASILALASQMAATSFTVQTQDPNEQLIDRLTANLAWLLEPLVQTKKKAKIDFILDLNKASTSTADNNKPLKAKVFKNSSKLEPPEIVQKSEKTPKTNKCPNQAELADNSNIAPLICKTQMAGYFIDLILDSGLSVSVIAKYFLKAIGRKIDEPSTRLMTNIHGDKKKDLNIAKAVSVQINGISIETNMEVSEAKEYTIIVDNKWLKKAKALLDYELCELTIRYGKKPIVVKCCHWTTPLVPKQSQKEEQSDESDDEESDKKNEQEE